MKCMYVIRISLVWSKITKLCILSIFGEQTFAVFLNNKLFQLQLVHNMNYHEMVLESDSNEMKSTVKCESFSFSVYNFRFKWMVLDTKEWFGKQMNSFLDWNI